LTKFFFIPFVLLLSGCTFSENSLYGTKNLLLSDTQYYENEYCFYGLGPFNLSNENKNSLITKTIKKANDDGLNGDSLVNIKIINSGYTVILFSKYCTMIQGNIIYNKDK